MPTNPSVKVDNDIETAAEVLASQIEAIANAAMQFSKSRLNGRAIEVLIQDATKLPRRDIRLVLDAAANLATIYLKPVKKQGATK